MNLGTKAIASACAMLTLAVAAAVSAQPAQARWIFHDSNFGDRITAPPGGTRGQTCATRLKAVTGFGEYISFEDGQDPATYQLPAYATGAVDYEVWKAPPGIDSFNSWNEDENGVFFEDPDGTRHPATLLARLTTPPRKKLPTPVPVWGSGNVSTTFLFATAPISVRLRGVKPGDVLGLRSTNHSFVGVTAMDCTRKVVKAKVDVIPGSRANTVQLNRFDELIPVRIYGSKRLNVKKINEVHLGEAETARVPADVKPKLRPKDVNRDGRLDRLYYFRQGDTGIICIDTSVKVTGRTSNKKYFQAKVPIATASCDG